MDAVGSLMSFVQAAKQHQEIRPNVAVLRRVAELAGVWVRGGGRSGALRLGVRRGSLRVRAGRDASGRTRRLL